MISKKRLLLTEDGKVVEEGNPAGVRLLVGAGGIVPDEHVELVKEYEKAAGTDTETETDAEEADLADEEEDDDDVDSSVPRRGRGAAKKAPARKK